MKVSINLDKPWGVKVKPRTELGIPHDEMTETTAMRLLKLGMSIGILKTDDHTTPKIVYRLYRINDGDIFAESYTTSIESKIIKGDELKEFLDVKSHSETSGQKYFLAKLQYNSFLNTFYAQYLQKGGNIISI